MTGVSPKVLALLASLTLIWGTNWPLFKIALDEIPVLTFRTVVLSVALVVLYAVVRLRGDAPSADNAELCHSVAGTTGLDAAPFVRVVRHRRGEAALKSGEASVVVSGCLDGLQRVVRYLDQFKQRA